MGNYFYFVFQDTVGRYKKSNNCSDDRKFDKYTTIVMCHVILSIFVSLN